MTQAVQRRARDLHPTTRYAVDVVDRRIVTGKPVLWACRRHLDDLEHGEKRAGLYFDETLADRIFRFFGELTFGEGERAGEKFELEPWQQFIEGSTFGWLREDGFRRFREVWVWVARGNGKSTKAAANNNYCTGWDGYYDAAGRWRPEMRAQVFTAATKLKQARIIHATALDQVEKSPYLRAHLLVRRDRIIHPATKSYFEPLGRDSKTEDGWNPLCASFDEVHAYANRGMWDVFESAMVKRRQPLIFGYSTAGYGGAGTFGVQQYQYYRQIIDPKSGVKNDAAFVYIAELDARVRCARCTASGKLQDGEPCPRCKGRGFTGDDRYDERNWIKANPNLGVSVYLEGMRERAKKAKINKRFEADFFVKNLNIQMGDGDRAISQDAWDASGEACPMPPMEELRQRPCVGGLDLASNRDLNALELYFPPCGPWSIAAVLSYFWVPEETVPVRLQADRIDYRDWIEAGEIETTPGEFTDQNVIQTKLNDLAAVFTIKALGCDRKFGEKLLPELARAGFAVHRIAQSFANLCVPWQELEKLIGRMQLAHGGHKVLRWNAGNVVLARDADNLVMPTKGKSPEKIDGIMALLNAMYLSRIIPLYEVPRQPEHHKLPARRGGGKRKILSAFKG